MTAFVKACDYFLHCTTQLDLSGKFCSEYCDKP